MARPGSVKDLINLLLITLHLAGGSLRGRTRLQKLAYIVWLSLKHRAEKDKLPPEVARIAGLEPEPGHYGGVFKHLEDAVKMAMEEGLVDVRKGVNVPEEYILTAKGGIKARTLLEMLERLEPPPPLADVLGGFREIASLPLNMLIELVYGVSRPEDLQKSKLIHRMRKPVAIAVGELSEELCQLLEDFRREGLVEKSEKLLDLGLCEELEPGLTLCFKRGRWGRLEAEIKIDPRAFEEPNS